MKNKTWLLAALMALASACGAEDNGAETVEYEAVETGTAEQAATYTLHQQHGIVMTSSYPRCNHASPNYSSSNPCVHPPRRNLGYNLNSASCGTSNTAVQGGLALAAQTANGLGWAVAEVSSGGTIAVRCVCNELASGTAGSTQFVGPSSGALRPYDSASIRIDLCRIEAGSIYAASTSAGKANIKTNVAKHELFHALGIGHNPGSPSCGTSIMKPAVSTCYRNLGTSSEPGLAQVERDMLSTFDVD